MATASRQPDPALTNQSLDQLATAAPEFEFFQAVRILQRVQPNRELVGYHGTPAHEAVRFSVPASLRFPQQPVQDLQLLQDAPPLMSVLFMGLIGPSGVLPTHLTAYVMDRVAARDHAMRAFLDLFQHRFVSLFYRAWERHRFAVPYERGDAVPFLRYLLSILGLGLPSLTQRQDIPDEALAYYSGLLSQRPRSKAGLEQILADFFQIPVQVLTLTGGWRPLDQSSWTLLDEGRVSEQLGVGVVLGDEIWDPQSRITLRIGPLTRTRYEDFLPGGKDYGPLRAFARFYCGDALDVDVQLVLDRTHAPALTLAVEDTEPQRLGWSTWLHTKPPQHDPDDAVLPLARH